MTKSSPEKSLEVKSYSLGHFSKFLAIFYFEDLGIIPKPTYGENYSSIF